MSDILKSGTVSKPRELRLHPGFLSDVNCNSHACLQNSDVPRAYSTLKTGLPAAMNGKSASHSLNWKHSSFSAQSKWGIRSGI